MKKNLAVLISNAGTGTNLQAIIDAVNQKTLNAKISIIVSDSNDAYGLIRAKESSIPTHILAENENLLELLRDKNIDYVCLTGWKKIIPQELIDAFPILNIHPGLIPDT